MINCNSCKYFEPSPYGNGECFLNPPTLMVKNFDDGDSATWERPRVHATDFCSYAILITCEEAISTA